MKLTLELLPTQRGRAFERRRVATYQSQQQSNGVQSSQTSQQRVVETTSHSDRMPTKSNDNDIDSALNDLMIVSQMATTSTPVENKGKKSVRLAESHHSSTQHVSSGPVQTASGATGSFSTRQQFYSYSSSSSSSSKQQVVSSSSSGQIELPAAQPERSIQHQSSGEYGVQASSSSSSHHHQSNKTVTSSSNSSANKQQVDYSRIHQNAAGSLTQQQLDSPVCNFTVRSSFNPLFVRLFRFRLSHNLNFRIIRIIPSTINGSSPNLRDCCATSPNIRTRCATWNAIRISRSTLLRRRVLRRKRRSPPATSKPIRLFSATIRTTPTTPNTLQVLPSSFHPFSV